MSDSDIVRFVAEKREFTISKDGYMPVLFIKPDSNRYQLAKKECFHIGSLKDLIFCKNII